MYNNLMNYHGGIYNLAGALWDIQTNAPIYTDSGGSEFFNNAGSLLKSGGSGTADVGIAFTNGGTVMRLTPK